LVRVTVLDAVGVSVTGSFLQRVTPGPHTVTITAGPTGGAEPGGPAGAGGGAGGAGGAAGPPLSGLVAGAGPAAPRPPRTLSAGHTLTYQWQATCPASRTGTGSFAPSAGVAKPTWTAPVNTTRVTLGCTLQVIVSDGQGLSQTGSYTQQVTSTGGPHTLTIAA